MKKILLLSPFYKPHYMRNARCDFVSWSGTNWYPMQLGYLGAFLESKKYMVKIIDAQAYGYNDYQVGQFLWMYMPDYVVIYAGNDSFEVDMAIAKKIENMAGCPTKLVGPFYKLNRGKYHVAGIDGCLETGVLDWIEGRTDPEKPVTGAHLSSEEMDKIPFVSDFFMKHLEPKYYRTPSEPWPFVDIMTGRGCEWGKCTFCLWPRTYKAGYTARSMENVIVEVANIEKAGFYKSIMIEDDTFPEDRIRKFCELKLEIGLKIPWSCLVRANLNNKTLKLMKRAGCLNLHVGYESGNLDTLIRIKKGITPAEMRLFTLEAKAAGLQIHGDFMVGIDSTVAQIRNTIRWACKLRPYTAQFQVYIPYFGDKTYLSKERLEKLARYAYRRFYSNPASWPAVIKQVAKPSILRESVKTILGANR